MIDRIWRTALAFVPALAVTYLVAVLCFTQFNLATLASMNVPVSTAVRFETTLQDLGGMTSLYLPIIFIALATAFTTARILLRWMPQWRTAMFVVAGFCAILAINYVLGVVALLMVGEFFVVHPFVVTRSVPGMLSQCAAGALGGYVFALCLQPNRSQPQE